VRIVQEGFLREERFAEQFVTQRAGVARSVARPHGLRDRGVEPETIDQAFDTTATDWVQAAREARRRKFGLAPPATT